MKTTKNLLIASALVIAASTSFAQASDTKTNAQPEATTTAKQPATQEHGHKHSKKHTGAKTTHAKTHNKAASGPSS